MENKIYGLGLTENYNESYIFYDGDLIEQIVTFVREKTAHEKIAIYGHRGSGRPLLAELEAKGLGGRMAAHYDLHHSRFDQFNKNPEIMVLNHDFSYLILCFYRKNYREKLRFLAKYIGQKCNIILPFAPEGCFDANKIEDPTPTVVFSFSCSGSNRVTPALEYLFQYFQRRTKGLDNLVRNTRYLYSVLEKGQNPSTEDIDSYYSQQIKYLDYYTWLYIHHPFSLKTLRDIKDIKIVVHMRDPRDIINSYYFRLYGDRSDNSEGFYIDGHCEEKKEERLLKMLEGGTFQKLNNYFLPWPSAKKMVDNYLEVQKHPNMRDIKFEDIHENPKKAYTELLDWLGFTDDFFVRLTDPILKEAIQKGSFERQTNNRRKRGEEHNHVQLKRGVQTSCRKGVVGDWKNNFTPRVIERFKELTGDGLIKLGYEKDMNW